MSKGWHWKVHHFIHSIHCGLHSGIRFCCVLEWTFRFTFWPYAGVDRRWADLKKAGMSYKDFSYVPCWLCMKLRKKPVEVRSCNCKKRGRWPFETPPSPRT